MRVSPCLKGGIKVTQAVPPIFGGRKKQLFIAGLLLLDQDTVSVGAYTNIFKSTNWTNEPVRAKDNYVKSKINDLKDIFIFQRTFLLNLTWKYLRGRLCSMTRTACID